jgi:hypothetical protein
MSPHRPEINRRHSIKLKSDPIDKPRQRSPRVSDPAFLSDYRIENPLVDRRASEMFEHRARTMRIAVSSFSRTIYLDRDNNADEHD